MIVNAAGLAHFPADGHALKDIVLEDEIARVVTFGEEEVLVQSFRPDVATEYVVLNILQSEFGLGNGGEALDPIADGELFDGFCCCGHSTPRGLVCTAHYSAA